MVVHIGGLAFYDEVSSWWRDDTDNIGLGLRLEALCTSQMLLTMCSSGLLTV